MLCVTCGKGAHPAHRGRIRLRPTGRPDEPFVMVCEKCGLDINADGTLMAPARIGTPTPTTG